MDGTFNARSFFGGKKGEASVPKSEVEAPKSEVEAPDTPDKVIVLPAGEAKFEVIPTLAEKMQGVFNELKEISQQKNAAYGSRNLSLTGEYGLAVRMLDKVSRLENLLNPGNLKKIDTGNEAVRDTALDLANYATYLVLMIDRKW